MDVTPLVRKGQQIIQAYARGVFKISGKPYETAVLVMPDETLVWPVSATSLDALCEDDFKILLDRRSEMDVFLLGTGETIAFLPKSLKSFLKAQGLHVEVMDTGAACRTYNVLMAEGRRVAAALLPCGA